MARNRLVTHLDDALIAAVAEKAAKAGTGFDEALEEVVTRGLVPVTGTAPAAPKKPAAKKSK